VLYSQEIQTGFAAGFGGETPTVTANAALAPDGTMTAEQIDFADMPISRSSVSQTVTVAAVPHTYSGYLKGASTSGTIYLFATPDGVAWISAPCSYNATTWTRCSVTGTPTATDWNWQIGNAPVDPSQSAQPGASVYVWGMDLKADPGLTSYIPTAGTTATRNLEEATITSDGSMDAVGCATATVTYGAYVLPNSKWLGFLTGGLYVKSATSLATTDDADDTPIAITIPSMASTTTVGKMTWTGSTLSVISGATTNSGAFAGTMSANLSSIAIGSADWGAQVPNAEFRNIRIGSSTAGCQ
jgi:hypothetical protein